MIQAFSRPANDFKTKAEQFIATEGFNRFVEVAIEVIKATDPHAYSVKNIVTHVEQLTRALKDIERFAEREGKYAVLPR